MRHIEPYSIIFRTLCNPYIYSHAIFRTLAYWEPQASSKACGTWKMVKHIQNPGTEQFVEAFSRMFSDIQGYWCTFSHVYRWATRGKGDLPWPFLKIKKSALILKKKTLLVSIFQLNFLFKIRVSRRKNSKMFYCGSFLLVFLTKCLSKCTSSAKPPQPCKVSGCAPCSQALFFLQNAQS